MWRGKYLLCLLFPALLLVSAAAAWSAPPVIQNVSVERGRDVDPGGGVEWHESVWVWVYDEDGADDIRSVAITDSEGNAHVIQPGTDSEAWVEEDATTVRVIWREYGTPSPPPPGPYGVIAEDSAGGTDSLVTAPAPEVLPLSPVLLYPIPENSLIYETVPTFSWTGGVPGACDVLDILDIWEETSLWYSLWCYEAGASTSVPYNADGTAAQSALTPGHSYLWVVHGMSCDDGGVTDPRVRISTIQNTYGRFTVASPNPSIECLSINRNHAIDDSTGEDFYSECGGTSVTDTHGWQDISVSVTDPAGWTHPTAGDCTIGCNDGHSVLSQRWLSNVADGTWPESGAGCYTITATNSHGGSATITTAEVPVMPPVQQIIWPTQGSVISDTSPTFTWEPVAGAARYDLLLEEAGQDSPVVWKVSVPASMGASIVYNSDGQARDPELTPGSRYQLSVSADCPSSDGLVMSTTRRVIEFWVAPKPDWLPPLRNGTSTSSPAGPYKRGSTIPVKFRLLDAAGQPVSDALARTMVAQLEVFYEKPSAQGTPIDPGDSPPDLDGVFRYQDGMFHYNLSTKNAAWLANYTYGLDLMINGTKAGEVFFSLK